MTSAKTKAGISPVPLDPLVGLESAVMDIADRLHGYAMLHRGMTPESWAMGEGRDEIIGLRQIVYAQRDLIAELEKVIELMQTGAQVELPDRPEPEDCESLSFDAYSGFQMLAYGRECAEAQRLLMAHNATVHAAGGALSARSPGTQS